MQNNSNFTEKFFMLFETSMKFSVIIANILIQKSNSFVSVNLFYINTTIDVKITSRKIKLIVSNLSLPHQSDRNVVFIHQSR